VAVHGRDAQKVERTVRALSELALSVQGERVRGFVADLASLEQTLALARQVEAEMPDLDVLVNNVGVGFGRDRKKRELSLDGHELRFAVNYLAPFALMSHRRG
jgi:NAD(P)-dependent dehydrogenase (short-subunit alcohol dehydrogenase family)